ncbi:MAG TPA: hypothetical protein VJR89_29655 [Polyangiales bacterium]|nr:hypothetical protein [Polyangiales bacterium]
MLLLALAIPSRSAHAYHDPSAPPIDDTAYTLRGGEFQLGLLKQHFGVHRRVQLSTIFAGYVVGAFSSLFLPNAGVKVRPFELGDVTFSVQAGFAYARFRPTSPREGTRADLMVLPMGLDVSWRPSFEWLASWDVTYVLVHSLAGASDLGTTDDLEGAASISNLSVGTNLLFFTGRVLAIGVKGRLLLFQSPVTVQSEQQVDEFTTVDVDGNVEVVNASWAWQLVPSVFLSIGPFNLRAGLGYGSVFVQQVGLVFPQRTIVPELEASFRF